MKPHSNLQEKRSSAKNAKDAKKIECMFFASFASFADQMPFHFTIIEPTAVDLLFFRDRLPCA